MPSKPKLSDAQRALLIRAVERPNEDGFVRLHGRGEHASYHVLAKQGLLGPLERFVGGAFAAATDDGRALVDMWRCASCRHVEYHCLARGCNHHDAERGDSGEASGWCDCEAFVPAPEASQVQGAV